MEGGPEGLRITEQNADPTMICLTILQQSSRWFDPGGTNPSRLIVIETTGSGGDLSLPSPFYPLLGCMGTRLPPHNNEVNN
ncbi:General amino acid permease AGP2 [Fusarium oxysporum f. sp. albedinis]|nr:General amino acid permease AGP2 [Fusarium oxysporum f. sp. albedinis]